MKGLSILLLFCFVALAIGTPAVKNVGIKWNSSPVYLNSNVTFINDADSKYWRSSDSGITWSQLKFGGNPIVASHIVFDNFDKNYVLLLQSTSTAGGASKVYISSNQGETFVLASFTGPLTRVSASPKTSKLLLAHSAGKIVMSKDFGSTWDVVNSADKQLYRLGSRYYLAPFWDPVTGGFFAILDKFGSNGEPCLTFSNDTGKTYTKLITNAVEINSTPKFTYIGVVDTKNIGKSFLYVRSNISPYNNKIMGFLECSFPFGDDLIANDYRIIDDGDGAIWMGVVFQGKSRYGSVYVSNDRGNVFILAKEYVAFSDSFDFSPLVGVPGAYLANIVQNIKADNSQPLLTQSWITYDNGGEWSRLTPPANGESCPGCYLNTHGLSAFMDTSRGYGPFYTIENGPGLIVATGTIKPSLSTQPKVERIHTFLSRDNGKSWSNIYVNGTIYEFGAYGSLLVMADCVIENTKTLLYSFDQGKSVQSVDMPGAYDVINIVTDPENANTKFVILAQDENDVPSVLTLDISGSDLPRACADADMIDFQSTCLLGVQTTYSVVNEGVRCVLTNKPEIESAVICNCTIDDFECDIGYTRTSNDTDPTLTCALTGSSSPSTTQSDCDNGAETYTVTRGFRKVAGTKCINGVENQYNPNILKCPSNSAHKKSKGWIAAVVILVLVAVLGGAGFFLYKNPDKLELIKKKIGMSKDTKYSYIGIKPNSLADDEFGIEDDDAQILNDNDLQDDDNF